MLDNRKVLRTFNSSNYQTTFLSEGKARGETKATAVSVQLQLQKHSSVTAEEEGHAQR